MPKKTATGTKVTLYNRIVRCGICGNPIGGVTGRAEAYRLRLVIAGKKRTLYMHISCGDKYKTGEYEQPDEKGAIMTRKEIEEVVLGARRVKPDPEKVRDLEARRDALRADALRAEARRKAATA